MQTEIEAKFLHISIPKVRQQLIAIGAVLQQPERLMRRYVYDFPDRRLHQIGGWVRVRDEGDKVTMSYKQLNDRTIQGTKEVNLTVDSFENASTFLKALGLASKSYQETKRESWKLGEVELELDTWPWIDPFIELEGPSEAALRQTAELLELPWDQALHGSVETAYMDEYDVTEAEIDTWDHVIFEPVPDWLTHKRRVS